MVPLRSEIQLLLCYLCLYGIRKGAHTPKESTYTWRPSAIKTQYKARINLGPLVGDQSWTRRGPEEDPPQTGCLALSLRLEVVPISPAAAVVEAGADSATECPAGERGSAGSGNT